VAIGAAVGWPSNAGAASASFMGLGLGTVEDVSADGSVVVGREAGGSEARAYRWTADGGVVFFDTLGPGTGGWAEGVSADGSVVVGATASTPGFEAFRWSAVGGMVGLGDLDEADGYFNSHATGVSADGSVVVGNSVIGLNSLFGFRWTAADGMVALDTLPGWFPGVPVTANAVSGDGSVIVGAQDSQAWRWTAQEGTVSLGFGTAQDVSADGSVIVGDPYFVEDSAWRWTQATGRVGLGVPHGAARGVSADGRVVVGGAFEGAASGGAFVWTPTSGPRLIKTMLVVDFGLDLTGWDLTLATAISSDGKTIVGQGIHDGHREAWIAVLPGTGACDDGVDNDGDDLVDFPDDPGCAALDNDEHSPTLPCDDGVDDDGDGKADFQVDGTGDPACVSVRSVSESPQCQDGLDNDGDGLIDVDGGASLDLDHDNSIDAQFNPAMPAVGTPDAHCVGRPWKNTERPGSCGLGFELVLLAPLLALMTRKRRV
jgi:probable HAF family extracellular repeat protein